MRNNHIFRIGGDRAYRQKNNYVSYILPFVTCCWRERFFFNFICEYKLYFLNNAFWSFGHVWIQTNCALLCVLVCSPVERGQQWPRLLLGLNHYCLACWEMQDVSNKWQQLLWPSTCPRGRGGIEAPGQDPCGLVSWRAREVPPLPSDSQQYLAFSSHPSLWLSVGDYLLIVPLSEKWKVLLWSLPVICATRRLLLPSAYMLMSTRKSSLSPPQAVCCIFAWQLTGWQIQRRLAMSLR